MGTPLSLRTLPLMPYGLFMVLLAAVLVLANADITRAQPANDDVANATPITSLPFDDRLDTTEATMAPDDPDCFGNGPTVWYTFTPTETVSLMVDAQTDTAYDATLSVYTGMPGALTPIDCSDGSVVFEAMAGTTYWLMVGSFFSARGGPLVVHAEAVPPALELDVTVHATGIVDPKTGMARVSGTVRCNTESTIDFIVGSLHQPRGNKVIAQELEILSLPCTPPMTAWSDTTAPGPFKKGTARVVDLHACGCHQSSCTCAEPQDPLTITLRQPAKEGREAHGDVMSADKRNERGK